MAAVKKDKKDSILCTSVKSDAIVVFDKKYEQLEKFSAKQGIKHPFKGDLVSAVLRSASGFDETCFTDPCFKVPPKSESIMICHSVSPADKKTFEIKLRDLKKIAKASGFDLTINSFLSFLLRKSAEIVVEDYFQKKQNNLIWFS